MPGKPFRVSLSPDVIGRMERDIQNTFRAVNGRGAEVGGILLGSNGDGATITDYRLLPCAYTRGPLWVLSDVEKRELREAARAQHALGFFRSHTRRELALGDEDVALARECFPTGQSVFLLVKPFAGKPPVAGLFCWDGADVRRKPYAEFTFRGEAARPHSTPEQATEPPVAEPAAAVIAFVPAGPPEPAPAPAFSQIPARSRAAKVAWVFFGLALAAGAGLFAYYDGWLPIPMVVEEIPAPPPPAPVKPPPALQQPESALPATRTVVSVETAKVKQAALPPAAKPRHVIMPEPPRIDTAPALTVPAPDARIPGPPPQAAAKRAADPNPAKVPQSRAPVLVRQEPPFYPVQARAAGVQGIVRLRAVIGKDGKVISVTPASGPVPLRMAAVEAVKKWSYLPALRNGDPVEGTAEIELRFALRN